MTAHTSFAQRLAVLNQATVKATLPGIRHGVEREALRINKNGSLAQTPHPKALGSSLTHEYITTDFSESLLEFITPPETDPVKTLNQLKDIHKYVLENIGDEQLWPLSMPCFIDDEDQIPIAQYGHSNIGKMKTLYRVGLKNRYGSMMQAIAGVHFNFSLPRDFWQHWLAGAEQQADDQDNISAAYFALIRNYRRFCWLIPYLFGASPALCSSFIQGKQTPLPFKTLGQGTYYLPFATSLRMSDLGYTNSAQSGLNICYNRLDSYIQSLRQAINTPSADYAKFAGKLNGEYQQLNANVLQIENELYSPIRPKQPTRQLEKPTDALAARGVSYIEVRALDVDPYSNVGIQLEQFYFLDVFLLYCLVKPSAQMTSEDYQQTEENLRAVVTAGRDPELILHRAKQPLSIPQWSAGLFDEMRAVAKVLDQANACQHYSSALEAQWQKIQDPDVTPSGKMLTSMRDGNLDNGEFALQLASSYKASLSDQPYAVLPAQMLAEQAADSLNAQKVQEQADNQSFDDFLFDYFAADEVSGKHRVG